MGSFDTLSDGDREIQVKCFEGNLKNYHVGDVVPELHSYHEGYRKWIPELQYETYTIDMDPYGDPPYALVKDKVFVGFTDDIEETYPPIIYRWGQLKIVHGHDFKEDGRCWGCGMKSSYWSEVLQAFYKGNFDYEKLTTWFCKPRSSKTLQSMGETEA